MCEFMSYSIFINTNNTQYLICSSIDKLIHTQFYEVIQTSYYSFSKSNMNYIEGEYIQSVSFVIGQIHYF